MELQGKVRTTQQGKETTGRTVKRYTVHSLCVWEHRSVPEVLVGSGTRSRRPFRIRKRPT